MRVLYKYIYISKGGTGSASSHRKGLIFSVFKEKIRTHLDLLSIPRLWGENVKTFRWDQRLQIQNLFMAFKQVPRCR